MRASLLDDSEYESKELAVLLVKGQALMLKEHSRTDPSCVDPKCAVFKHVEEVNELLYCLLEIDEDELQALVKERERG